MKRVIVTGGLGFIGSNLVDLLLNKNYQVINLDKISYSSSFYNVKDFKNDKNYKFIKCDLNNTKKIYSLLNKIKPHCIFNLAAETHVDRSIDGPKKFIESNILGVFSLLESFKKFYQKNKDTILIHVSTDEVYGDILKGRSTEGSSYKPSSPYAATKASSDHLVSSYIRTFNIPAIVTNCSNNYGPKQHPEKLIPKIIYNILNNKEIPIYGNGKNSREWIHVTDHCEALIKVFEKGKIGDFYNIGSNINLNNIIIAKELIKIGKNKIQLGKKVKIRYVKDRPGHDLRYALNSNKIKKKINWKPKIKIKKGLIETFNWYYENKKYYSSFKKKDITKRLGNQK